MFFCETQKSSIPVDLGLMTFKRTEASSLLSVCVHSSTTRKPKEGLGTYHCLFYGATVGERVRLCGCQVCGLVRVEREGEDVILVGEKLGNCCEEV